LGVGGSLDPLEALKTYLDNRLDLKELGPDMLEAAKNLLNGEQEADWLASEILPDEPPVLAELIS
jgi:hypothetical protein